MMSEHRECSMLGPGGTDLPLVEPEQLCRACGAPGTVGRIVINSRDGTRQELHRFCLRCWPEESARYEARWKDRRPNSFQALMDADAIAKAQMSSGASLFDLDPMSVGMGFESATWHSAAVMVEKLNDLIVMVRHGRVPTEAQLTESALEIAREIEAAMDTRVGPMPYEVGEFLLEFGSDSAAANRARREADKPGRAERELQARIDAKEQERTARINRARLLDDDIAAAHASADAVIAEFDKALEALTVPATPESRAVIEKELVEMLQHLEQEIATEASELATWQSAMQEAAERGDAYTIAKLTRLGDDRMVRLHGLRSTMADVEQLHERLLSDR